MQRGTWAPPPPEGPGRRRLRGSPADAVAGSCGRVPRRGPSPSAPFKESAPGRSPGHDLRARPAAAAPVPAAARACAQETRDQRTQQPELRPQPPSDRHRRGAAAGAEPATRPISTAAPWRGACAPSPPQGPRTVRGLRPARADGKTPLVPLAPTSRGKRSWEGRLPPPGMSEKWALPSGPPTPRMQEPPPLTAPTLSSCAQLPPAPAARVVGA